jgi:hypothetical protein
MLQDLKIKSIGKIGHKTKYLEFVVMYTSLMILVFYDGAKGYSNIIMSWTVIFILFTRISVLFARQSAILRVLKSVPLAEISSTREPKKLQEK